MGWPGNAAGYHDITSDAMPYHCVDPTIAWIHDIARSRRGRRFGLTLAKHSRAWQFTAIRCQSSVLSFQPSDISPMNNIFEAIVAGLAMVIAEIMNKVESDVQIELDYNILPALLLCRLCAIAHFCLPSFCDLRFYFWVGLR